MIQNHDEERQLRDRVSIPRRNAKLVRFIKLIYFLTGALEVLLLIRFVLRLTGANPESGFAKLIYGLSRPFVIPFANLFSTPVLDPQQVFDINALVALVAYAIVAWLVARLLWLTLSKPA